MTSAQEDEIWKPVHSKPGFFASSWGRVKMPETTAAMPNGAMRLYKPKPTFGHVQRSNKNAKHHYLGLGTRHYGTLKVHRLVCEAFHGPAPGPRMVVIHLDESGTNNRPENLKWGTQKENLNMPKFIAYCRSRTGKNNPYLKGKRAQAESCLSPI